MKYLMLLISLNVFAYSNEEVELAKLTVTVYEDDNGKINKKAISQNTEMCKDYNAAAKILNKVEVDCLILRSRVMPVKVEPTIVLDDVTQMTTEYLNQDQLDIDMLVGDAIRRMGRGL